MQQSWIAAQSASINAKISGYIDEGTSYLKLKKINQDLIEQNKVLMKEEVYGSNFNTKPKDSIVRDSMKEGQEVYEILDADVVNNSINRKNNYFTINRGTREGVESQMAVISPRGIAGIVVNKTKDYAVVQSVLSVNNIRINAALKKSNYFGTLRWLGEDPRIMHLSDIPKYVSIKVGDTVVTDGKSAIFPQGIMIGTIAGYQVDTKTGFWDIAVELNEKMGQLSKVYVVKNLKKVELNQIRDSLKVEMKKND